MSMRAQRLMLTGALIMLLAGSAYLLRAQNDGGPMPGGPPPGFGAPGNPGQPGFGPPDPARMQEMMLGRVQEVLNASDEEWTAIKPLVSEVLKLQRGQIQGRGGMMGPPPGMMGGPGGSGRQGGQNGPGGPNGPMLVGGPGGPGAPGGPGGPGGMFGTPSPEATALQAVLSAENPVTDEIKAKLDAFRAARQKKAEELKAAREKLRLVLTLRQEATLVLAGLLE